MDPLTPVFDRLRRARQRVLWHRRPLAAACAALAVLAGVQAVRQDPSPTVQVWTVTRDLPSGTRLDAADLRRVPFAEGTAPRASIARLNEVEGRVLAAPMTAGEPMTRTKVVSEALLSGYPGLAAVPVRLGDPEVAGLLRVGDEVTLVSASDEDTGDGVLTEDAPVIAIPTAPQSGPAGAIGVGGEGSLILVGVPPSQAGRVATSAARAFVTAVWNR